MHETHSKILLDVVSWINPDGTESCTSGFQDVGQLKPSLGDVFLREYYSIHDAEKMRLGFAKAVE